MEAGSGALSFPFPVIAVSNLSAVRRQAVRLGGTVTVVNVGQPSLAAILSRGGASGGSGTPLGTQPPPAAAILTDPEGVSSLVLHLFKRNPVMAMALGSSSPHTLGGVCGALWCSVLWCSVVQCAWFCGVVQLIVRCCAL